MKIKISFSSKFLNHGVSSTDRIFDRNFVNSFLIMIHLPDRICVKNSVFERNKNRTIGEYIHAKERRIKPMTTLAGQYKRGVLSLFNKPMRSLWANAGSGTKRRKRRTLVINKPPNTRYSSMASVNSHSPRESKNLVLNNKNGGLINL